MVSKVGLADFVRPPRVLARNLVVKLREFRDIHVGMGIQIILFETNLKMSVGVAAEVLGLVYQIACPESF